MCLSRCDHVLLPCTSVWLFGIQALWILSVHSPAYCDRSMVGLSRAEQTTSAAGADWTKKSWQPALHEFKKAKEAAARDFEKVASDMVRQTQREAELSEQLDHALVDYDRLVKQVQPPMRDFMSSQAELRNSLVNSLVEGEKELLSALDID